MAHETSIQLQEQLKKSYYKFGLNNFTLLITMFILTLMYQIIKFKKDSPKKCLEAFKLNNISCLFLFFGIILIN